MSQMGYVVCVSCSWSHIDHVWHVHWACDLEPLTIKELPDDDGTPGVLENLHTTTARETYLNASPGADLAAAERIMGEKYGPVEVREIAGRTVIIALEPMTEALAQVKASEGPTPPCVRLRPLYEPPDPSSAPGSGCILLLVVTVCWFVACILGGLHG